MVSKETSDAPLAAQLSDALSAAGYRSRMAPVRLAWEVERTISALVEQGPLAQSLYDDYADYLRFVPPPEIPETKTLIVVAWPSPAVKVRFQFDAGPLEAVIPPTYISSAGRERCLQILRSILDPLGLSVARAGGPVKLLAVRAGLARYGRNNLAYVPGLGSYTRLEVFSTDADLQAEEHVYKGSMLMSSCPPCRNCHHVCPTGCIPHAGTVIDAGRCLTHLNENQGEWPEWLDPSAHRCLVGCMRCQEMCPANRYYLRNEPVVAEFDAAETAVILENRPPARLPEDVRAKLRDLDLEGYSPVLGRNLLALRAGAK